MLGMLGEKIGMTQFFNEDGTVEDATVLLVGPCVISQLRTKEKDGYQAVQCGFKTVKAGSISKAELGHLNKAKLSPHKYLKEFRVDDISGLSESDVLNVALFQKGDMVAVTATTKGRGFQGVVKRHRMGGGPATHGGDCNRRPGSTGMRTDPHRVPRGKRMPGHMGCVTVTTSGLRVLNVMPEDNIILVKGAVPGCKNALVEIVCKKAKYSQRMKKDKTNVSEEKTGSDTPKEVVSDSSAATV